MQISQLPLAKRLTSLAIWALLGLGGFLLALNLYGLAGSLRHPKLATESRTRFTADLKLDWHAFQAQVVRAPNENQRDYALRLTTTIQKGICHLEWEDPEVAKYHLRIPPWENYLLYGMSYVRPGDYQKYHFSSPEKTIERGVGICGDAASLMSSLLDRAGIDNQILAFPEHVIVAATLPGEAPQHWLLDPDFGVAIPITVQQLQANPESIRLYYVAAGYSPGEVDSLVKAYAQPVSVFDNTFEFSPKRALFERASYIAIWVIPLLLFAAAGMLCLRARRLKEPS